MAGTWHDALFVNADAWGAKSTETPARTGSAFAEGHPPAQPASRSSVVKGNGTDLRKRDSPHAPVPDDHVRSECARTAAVAVKTPHSRQAQAACRLRRVRRKAA
ncbi:hypothetical protein Scani_39930 [Streptomyces caniferus]|uniref:Uncharacterized protein n=1 Tax=Streptomyces caniferus TaxID=285557 RepID=A0A640SDS1_9ACTN|nr:hypothetical protein Scani_39930 [Streptomyces caniferus]